jgi:hypothetical protein
VLIDRANLRRHWFWLLVFLAGTVGSTLWYIAECREAGRVVGGASNPGFTFGLVAGLIMFFEFFLWPRKTVFRVRLSRVLGPTESWLRAHIWLGFLSIPLITYHSGFRFGGTLSTIVLLLFIVVITSGVYGLILQNVLPRRMLDEVPAETIYSQIGYVSQQLEREASALVRTVCGLPAEPRGSGRARGAEEEAHPELLTVGAVRAVGCMQGKVLQTVVPTGPIPNSEPLHVFYDEYVHSFLVGGARSSSPLRAAKQSEVLFRDLVSRLPSAAHAAATALEGMCEQRRQFDRQARMHWWLHSWLWLHLPLAFALVVIMVFHAIMAIKYW